MLSDPLQKIKKLTDTIKKIQNQINPENSYNQLSVFTNTKCKISNKTKNSITQSNNKKIHIEQFQSKINKIQVKLIKSLFNERCKGLQISQNEQIWKGFVKMIYKKNINYFDSTISSKASNTNQFLDFSQLTLTQNCSQIVNKFLIKSISHLNLSKNQLNFKVIDMKNIKTLVLHNCGLHNQSLQFLFQVLIKQNVIQSLDISSIELNQRNILTHYDKLYQMLQKCKTLVNLEMCNIGIKPDNQIFAYCRKSTLKHLNLSKNNQVAGMAPNLLSLNLSHNNISRANGLIISDSRLKQLNISHNLISFYRFHQFLKYHNLNSLTSLNLNSIAINGECQALQIFISQSRELKELKLVQCSLQKQSWFNLIYGLRSNYSITDLDISKNQIPNIGLAKQLGISLFNSNIRKIRVVLCNLSDNLGQALFSQMKKNKTVQQIIASQNKLGNKTANILSTVLKTNYTICCLQFSQNFISYLKQNQLKSYIDRNKYCYTQTIKKQYLQLKGVNQQYNNQLLNLQSMQKEIKHTKMQKNNLQIQYYKKRHTILEKQKQDMKNNIKGILALQSVINKKIEFILESQGSNKNMHMSQSIKSIQIIQTQVCRCRCRCQCQNARQLN